MLKNIKSVVASVAICAASVAPAHADRHPPTVQTEFVANDDFAFTARQKAHVAAVLDDTMARVAEEFPQVSKPVKVTVSPVHRPILDTIGGVTGRADRPDELVIEISQTYPGGIEGAVDKALAVTVLHELHHTIRGWTMHGNHFGTGMQIAVINEGLATVFAEEILGTVKPSDLPPEEIEDWVAEVLSLPRDANYGEWMFRHPDGRESIGYRTGRWVVRRAMERSGLTIVELTDLTPAAIWQLAGYEWDRQLR